MNNESTKYQCPKCKSKNVTFEMCTHSMVAANTEKDYHYQIIDGTHEIMTAYCGDCEHKEENPDEDFTWTENK